MIAGNDVVKAHRLCFLSRADLSNAIGGSEIIVYRQDFFPARACTSRAASLKYFPNLISSSPAAECIRARELIVGRQDLFVCFAYGGSSAREQKG